MRRSLVAGSVIAGLGLFAGCVDLFHSTDFPTLCQLDASALACDAPATPLPTDFCKWTTKEAADRATEACTRLAACDSPVGNNATGACIANATLAYDCLANPNFQVKGASHAHWDRLWQAKTCEDVDRAIFGGKASTCVIMKDRLPFTTCDRLARVDCQVTDHRLFGESCAASGRACDQVDGGGSVDCTGTDGHQCIDTRCDATRIHVCSEAGVDNGFDCTSFGAGTCAYSDDAGPACVPSGTTTACTASGAVTCDGNVAVGCPTGTEVRVDCAALTGRCAPTKGGKAYDVSRACTIARVNDAGGCSDDVCSGTQLIACVRGAQSTPIDCQALKLGACRTFTTADGDRAACAAPP